MTKRKKMWLWIGLIFSLPAFPYAGISVIFYSWISTVAPERWPADKANLWVSSSLALISLFFILFVYCLTSLIKEANRHYREEQNRRQQD